MTDPCQFIRNLTDFLEYKKEEGFQTLEISPQTREALKAAVAEKRAAGALSSRDEKPNAGAVSHSRRYESSGPTPPPTPKAESTVRVTGATLEAIAGQIRTCSACGLSDSRTHTVPGEGNPNRPDILFIGEGPGAEEDAQGIPFIGAAGQLLDKMIHAMGYTREEIFIANIVKCRPPGNRVPLPEEMTACLPYLKAQIALIQPKLIVALGKTAVEGLLGHPVAITRFRGTWSTYEGIGLMPTYHPAYLLRSPGRKGEAWADLKAVLAKLGKEPPVKKTKDA
jgi:DNA polymerase